jgi:hypothetical protein
MESESGISFTEFTYQLLQGYDFVHLRREHGVRVQVRAGRWAGLPYHPGFELVAKAFVVHGLDERYEDCNMYTCNVCAYSSIQ